MSKPKHTRDDHCPHPKCLVQTEQLGDVTANLIPGPCKGTMRGFAAMPKEEVSRIAANGGISAHKSGRAHEFTPDEAKVAGQKGGRALHDRRGRELHKA